MHQERAIELQPKQVVGFAIANLQFAHDLGRKVAFYLSFDCFIGSNRTGYLQRYPRSWRQIPSNGQLCSAGANVHGGGKFYEPVPAFVNSMHKNWNGQRKALPIPAFVLSLVIVQAHPR